MQGQKLLPSMQLLEQQYFLFFFWHGTDGLQSSEFPSTLEWCKIWKLESDMELLQDAVFEGIKMNNNLAHD